MKIIGNGRDYYDGGLKYGRDDDLVFRRVEKQLTASCPLKGAMQFTIESGDNYQKNTEVLSKRTGHVFDFNPFVVYFAGKRYRGYYVSSRIPGWVLKQTSQWVYSADKLLDILAENGMYVRPHPYYYNRNNYNFVMDSFRAEFYQQDKAATDYCVASRIAVAVTCDTKDVVKFPHLVQRIGSLDEKERYWAVNGTGLSDIRFASALSVPMAFQELSMFIGNLPAEGNPMVKITDDKVKLHKAGFDPKSSFRHPVKIPHRKFKK